MESEQIQIILDEDHKDVTNRIMRALRGKTEGLTVEDLTAFINQLRKEARDGLFPIQQKFFQDMEEMDKETEGTFSKTGLSPMGGVNNMLNALNNVHQNLFEINEKRKNISTSYTEECRRFMEELLKKYNLSK